MHVFWKKLGMAAIAVACWMTAHATVGATSDSPLPAYLAQAMSSEPRPEPVVPPRPTLEVQEEPPLRQLESPRSSNRLSGVANGLGNTIIIDNGNGSSKTVLENSRNGTGNRIVIQDGQVVTDLSPLQRPRCDRAQFGDIKFYSPMHHTTLYWNPRTLSWYRFDTDQGDYVPAEWN